MSDLSQDYPDRAVGSPTGAVIAAALAALEGSNPAAHALLVSCCQEGFFEGQPGKRLINQLADRLLATVGPAQGDHAD